MPLFLPNTTWFIKAPLWLKHSNTEMSKCFNKHSASFTMRKNYFPYIQMLYF